MACGGLVDYTIYHYKKVSSCNTSSYPDEDLSYVDSIRQLQHSIIDDSYAAIKKGRFSPYDNLRINSPHHSSDIITYRSFKENHQNTNNSNHTDYLRG
ncbi:unnamed protein product [Didymodactylos carnosus]|uniref:Uncharacterized protein n=1 Tax=Didymodactylos carnosus TaxID=1234261 RepID=A0A815LZG8_9BILA|nr:unnamed protein product [Didymodactylos carnosus]CAF4299527.1 unnamed protein product [Didymodactylos carnosus]